MPRKRTLGFCIFFHDDHYYIPWGKMDQCPEGDGYLGLGNKGEHISFHKKKRFYRVKCPRCGGLGMDLERLEKYRI